MKKGLIEKFKSCHFLSSTHLVNHCDPLRSTLVGAYQRLMCCPVISSNTYFNIMCPCFEIMCLSCLSAETLKEPSLNAMKSRHTCLVQVLLSPTCSRHCFLSLSLSKESLFFKKHPSFQVAVIIESTVIGILLPALTPTPA